MLYQKNYFTALLNNLSTRSERAAQGLLSLGNQPLRDFIHNQLTGAPGTAGAWLADPVFEPTFGWEESQETMGSLAGSKLLHKRLAEVMAFPPTELAKKPTDYSFPLDRHPFTHQLAAWDVLNRPEPQSLVVTSGTGSGKTECFLVPVLNSLAKEIDAGEDTEGVRALFIYPLNALINSQQKRLDAWTDGFGGNIRHCLYTGALENELKASDQKYKGQVIDRKSLRERPPQMLVTNATMLEYMLVRKEDESILQKSAGKLRWIILDEAHTHVGSQAAEMALLLRRTMLAFQVKPEDVRFVATSATFGTDEKTIEGLRNFLADIGGVSPEQVHVVQGRRHIPALQNDSQSNQEYSLESIAEIDSEYELSDLRYLQLSGSKKACEIRNQFITDGKTQPQSLIGLAKASGLNKSEVLAWLDLMSGTKNTAGIAFLPVRAHLFHNVIPSIRACVDSKCTHKVDTHLNHKDWPFGMVYLEERSHCDCGAPLMPLVSCEECNESFLKAACTTSGRLIDQAQQLVDEFSLEDDPADEDEDGNKDGQADDLSLLSQTLVTNRSTNTGYTEFMERSTQKLMPDGPKEGYIELQVSRSDRSECPCCGANSKTRNLLRHARIGTPFTLSTVIGNLLEFCPEDEKPSGKPFQGRKLISFTDSRQGTARIAVKLQQDSERNRIRGLVYHYLLQSKPINPLSIDQQNELKRLEELNSSNTLNPHEKMFLALLKQQQEPALSSTKISWTDMVNHLAGTPDIQMGMLDHYHDQAPRVFSTNNSVALAGMLLAREFYRRPKRANSLETLGLAQVCYPKLTSITTKPMAWPANKDLESWRTYLKVLLDFFIRENTVLNIDQEWQRLIGAKIRPKWVVAPVSDGLAKKLTGRYIRWPSVNQVSSVQSRAVLLLCKAFNWSAKTHQDQIDSILQDAWKALTTTANLLISSGDGYQFDLKNMSFSLPKAVYRCPVTRRFIDTTFEQLSPYTPRTDRDVVVKVTPFELPNLPEDLIHIKGEAGLLAIRRWLDAQSVIEELRREGLWSDVMDLVMEGGHYFRAAEHSAQQSKKKLDKYEGLFNVGKLNLLSCSTTMEMGVDIDGITVVAMNNVPPHPANYLQRAGRAGRRREGRALALTVCKNTPHDQSVFKNPLWPFITPMRMPKVSLQSPDLVQRHVNAWLLSHWLKHVLATQEIKSMTTGAFFLNGDIPQALAERFCLWCDNQISMPTQQVTHAINDITRRSILGTTPHRSILTRSSESIKKILQTWRHEHSASNAQLLQIGDKKSAASRAMEAQLARIEKEYLLSELADRRFLPGYGFPTDIVSFDNSCIQALKQEETKSREDNRARYRSLPSRDRVTGLREYAPGAELVIDGLVYKSSGITLNWHAPASAENVKELQLFKKSWFCRHCGTSDSAINPGLEINCQECGACIDREDIREYIVPAGFAVDFFDDPHNDVSSLQYVPVKAPQLNVPSTWISLANPALGQFRASQHAHLFNHSSGANQKGFAICLECGKAEPMLSYPDSSASVNEQYLPAIFREKNSHRRLRGGKNNDGENICTGSQNSWKIKQNIHLGHDSLTDALELILRNPKTGELLNDDVTGYSIAVALRESISADLGVQTEELGCDCREIRVDGNKTYAVRVFDLRSGGYTTQAAERLNERSLWERVLKRLSNCGCASACQNCLLSFDTRFESERLDRHAALEWIDQIWIDNLALPTELCAFGSQSKAEVATLQEAIEREISRDDSSKTIGIYLTAPAERWDLSVARNLRRQLLNWESAGHDVRLYLHETTFAALSDDQKDWLARITFNEINIWLYSTNFDDKALILNITLQSQSLSCAWASDNIELTTPDAAWNLATVGARIVNGPAPKLNTIREVNYDEIAPKVIPGIVKIELKDQLDGSANSFASRLWQHLRDNTDGLLNDVLTGKDAIVALTYTDRYVCNPLVVNLLVNIIYELKKNNDDTFAIKIMGRQYQKYDGRSPWQCWHDWPTSTDRDNAIRLAMEYCGLESEVISLSSLPHYRQLQLMLSSGKQLNIQFDQGISYWEAERAEKSHMLRFNFDAKELGEEIMERIQCRIVSAGDENTQLFISKSK